MNTAHYVAATVALRLAAADDLRPYLDRSDAADRLLARVLEVRPPADAAQVLADSVRAELDVAQVRWSRWVAEIAEA